MYNIFSVGLALQAVAAEADFSQYNVRETSLDLSGKRIGSIKNMGVLTNLEYLSLHNSKLTALPPEIGKLTNLKCLDLSRNNLETLPPEIGDLKYLERLNLSRNNLETVPIEIGKLCNLKLLNLRKNNIAESGDGETTMGKKELKERFRNCVKFGHSAAYEKKREKMQLWKMVLGKTLFLSELGSLLESIKGKIDISVLIESSQNTFQKHILEMIKKSIEKDGKQDKEAKIMKLLSKIVQEIKDLHPAVESKYKSKVKEMISSLIKGIQSQGTKNVMDIFRKNLDISSRGFNDYLESAIFSVVNALGSDLMDEGREMMNEDMLVSSGVETVQSIAMVHMLEYLTILDSMQGIFWGSESRSFDGTDITLTRPGFGAIVMVEPGQGIYKLIDAYKDQLLMRTRDVSFHMTVFQVFIIFTEDYNCKSLPVNLLQVFNAYMDKFLDEAIRKIETNTKISDMHVSLTDEVLVLGRDYPSALVVKVECKGITIVLEDLKNKINQMGYKWMLAMAEELKHHGFMGDISTTPVGAVVNSNGWKLIIGYTANLDYKTHITLGLLRSGLRSNDKSLIRMYGDVERRVDATFLPTEGDPILNRMNRKFRMKMDHMRNKYMNRMNIKELGKKEMDEWLASKMDKIKKNVDISEQDRYIRVSRINRSVINMNRIPNFEPIQ